MRLIAHFAIAAMLAAVIPSSAPADELPRDVLYQLSTLPALKAGVYDGFRSYAEILPRGDFGIGTFENLDGEMVMLTGAVFQVRADGSVHRPADTTTAPYVTVTFFEIDQVADDSEPRDYAGLQAHLDRILVQRDIPCAIKIRGVFDVMKARSVPPQTKPYPTLEQALEHQSVFMLNNVTGTMVGFRFPKSLEGVQATGYHFHFLTDDRTAGGHVLDCQTRQTHIEIDHTYEFHLDLPRPTDPARVD